MGSTGNHSAVELPKCGDGWQMMTMVVMIY